MKKLIIGLWIFVFLLSFTTAANLGTIDQFSDSSIDTSIWDTAVVNGGTTATIDEGADLLNMSTTAVGGCGGDSYVNLTTDVNWDVFERYFNNISFGINTQVLTGASGQSRITLKGKTTGHQVLYLKADGTFNGKYGSVWKNPNQSITWSIDGTTGGVDASSWGNLSITFQSYSACSGGESIVKLDWVNYSTGISGLYTTLSIPANDTSLAGTYEAFNASFNALNATLTNATLYIWNSTGNILNKTTNTITGNNLLNTTLWNITNWYLDSFTWNVEGCVESGCVWGTSNRTFDYGYTNNAETFTASVGDLTPTTIQINTTLADTILVSSALLNYSGTTYLGSKSVVGPDTIWSYSLNTPSVDATTDYNFTWILSLTDSRGTHQFITDTQTQSVTPSIFTECNATYPVLAVNYTIWDELNISNPITADFDATFTWNIGGSTNKNLSFELGGANRYGFCIAPNSTFFVDATITLSASGYETRTYTLLNESYSNASVLQPLYLLESGNSTNVIIEVTDQGLSPLREYLVEIYKYYATIDEYILVESQETDYFGQFVAKLVENDARYKFKFYDTNKKLVKTSQDVSIACRSAYCVIPFVIEDTEDDFERFDDISDYEYTLSWSNVTNTFTFTWTDNTGQSPTHRLEIVRYTINGSEVVYNSTSTSLSSSLSYAVGDQSASYTAQAFRLVGSNEIRIAQLSSSVGGAASIFGLEGLLIAFIFLMTLIVVGIWSPVVSIVLFAFGFIVIGIVGVIHINPAIIAAVVVICGLFVWSFKLR